MRLLKEANDGEEEEEEERRRRRATTAKAIKKNSDHIHYILSFPLSIFLSSSLASN